MPTLTDVSVKKIGDPTADNIVSVLNARQLYGITVDDPVRGPLITGFPLKIPPRIPIKKILPLEEDIAMACDVEAVTIQRMGNRIIVFIPNKERKVVNLLDNMYWFLTDENVKKMQLPILLGQNHIGENAAIDLAEQPHILIGGTTGGGKSTLESAIIAALALQKTPSELQMYLVDTKRLDLTLFEGLPNVKEVVRSAKEWYPVINGLYAEVQRRNILLERFECRNLAEYNAKVEQKMPYIVLVIDELADLIEKDKAQIEEDKREDEYHEDVGAMKAIQRVIQVSRASGIHIIACTQRTSAVIVSPEVKANFPTRIGLKCASEKDSVIIIGQRGCEKLLGKGDMMVQHAESEIINRYHGPFVRIEDIKAIIGQADMIKEQLLGANS